MIVAEKANMQKRSYRNLPLQEKRVLVRVDYNVPIQDGKVSDDSRIRASLPTLEFLLRKKAKIILIAHLGRPKGQVNPKYSLKPVVEPLSRLIKIPVQFVDDCIGPSVFDAVAKLKPGDVLLLENLRFHAEEEKGNAVFGKELASLADFFVQDAFGAVHRAHASTTVIPRHLESGAGALLEKELKFLNSLRSHPQKPFIAILGGAKVSDKIGVVDSLLDRVDALFIGGAMAYTFLKAKGHTIGDSILESDSVDYCKRVLDAANDKGVRLLLPDDHLIVQDLETPSQARTTDGADIPPGWKGVDVGPKTIEALKTPLQSAKAIFWNGPAGIFEVDAYSKGTMAIAEMVAAACKRDATGVVGGGDSVAAVKKAGVADSISYISTGGGASLEFMEGKNLPGVDALPDA